MTGVDRAVDGDAGPGPTVLVVCTANICRSPMGEALLRRRAAEAAVAVQVSSAGFVYDGEPAARDTVAAMAALGLDISGHRSRIVTPDLVAGADLVVTMERAHVRTLTVDFGGRVDRTFTLGSLPDLGELPGAGLADKLAVAAERRGPHDLLGRGDDEVEDPYGRARRHHLRVAERIDDLVSALVPALRSRPVSD